MPWRCAECGRTYDQPPGACSCGSSAVEPDDGSRENRFSVAAVRRRLLDPGAADRSLVADDGRVALAFRVLALVSLVLLAAVVILILV